MLSFWKLENVGIPVAISVVYADIIWYSTNLCTQIFLGSKLSHASLSAMLVGAYLR